MKNIKTILTMGLLLGSMNALAEQKYQAGAYDIDVMHSKVGFEIPHLVISTVEGKFNQFEGKVQLADKFAQSKVEASIDLSSIDTGVAKRDDHLKSADFFDVKTYPKMTFKSSELKGNLNLFKMTGDLTIHGVTRKVTFEGKYLGTVVDGYGNQKVAFQAKAVINRKDFGLTWNNMVEAGPVVGDQVTIDLKIQAAKPVKAETKVGSSTK